MANRAGSGRDDDPGGYAARDLVSGAEVVDFLLDLRLIADEPNPEPAPRRGVAARRR